VLSVSFSPDGKRLVAGGESGRAYIWDVSSGKLMAELRGHTSRVWDVAWGTANGRVATGSADLTARVWDPDTGECLVILSDFTDPVYSVRFSKDGKHLYCNSAGSEFVVY
jgi:WD40 repeat protein